MTHWSFICTCRSSHHLLRDNEREQRLCSLITLKPSAFVSMWTLSLVWPHGNRGAACLLDTQQRRPKNSLCLLPDLLLGLCPAVTWRRLAVFFHLAGVTFDRSETGADGWAVAWEASAKQKTRGVTFEEKSGRLEARRPVEDQKNEGKYRKGNVRALELRFKEE